MKTADADFLPVVQRELREGARRPFNYWLRVAGAAAGVLLLLFTINPSENGNQASAGLRLFTGLHEMLLVLICAMVPAMSADCIARENREGTLGLLFLTPLTPMGVVLGKSLVQAFRAFTLWLAVLPVIIIPFLSGGVTGGDIFSAITIEFCVTLLCLAAGVLASSVAKARTTAYMLAAVFGVGFVWLFAALLGLGFLWQILAPGDHVLLGDLNKAGLPLLTGQPSGGIEIAGGSIVGSGPGQVWVIARNIPNVIILGSTTFASPLQRSAGWGAYFSFPASRSVWRSLLFQCWLAVPLFFLLVLRFAAHRIATSWHDKAPSPRRDHWIKIYCMPLARRRFARKMQETLEWNPIAWLQQYSWQARVSKWGLCLAMVLVECACTTGNAPEIVSAQFIILPILAAAFTFVAVSGFLTEKKNGALELLLVTPVSPEQIIFGRVWGLWKQFLPAGLTVLLIWQFVEYLVSMSGQSAWPPWRSQDTNTFWSLLTSPLRGINWIDYGVNYYNRWGAYRPSDSVVQMIVTVTGFLALPVFATYFALRVKNLIVATVLTWLALFLCPYFAFTAIGCVSGLFEGRLSTGSLYVGVFMSNLAFALLACFLLRHSLSRRIYSF